MFRITCTSTIFVFVTQDLFNLDSKIELLYVYYEYIVTNAVSETGYYKYYTRVINESGSELLKIDGALYSYIYKVNDSEYNLFIYGYDYSSWPYDVTTDIYSFPGQPYFLSLENTSKSASIIDAYPNPAENFVNVNYSLPEDVSSALLEIYSIQGTPVAHYPISNQENTFRLPTSTYPSGAYLYHISANGQKSKTQQLIIK